MMHNSSVHRPPHGVKALTKDLIFTKTRNDNLQGIKNLNLWGNDLQDLSLLNQMPNLEVISLSVNNIKTLKYFGNCFKLKELYLRKNNIQVLNQIEYLMNLPELKVLWLGDNPCANNKNYRQIVLRNLPNLIKLDNDVVNQAQKHIQRQSMGIQQSIDQHLTTPSKNQKQIQRPTSSIRQGNSELIKPKNQNFLHQLQQNRSQLIPKKNIQNSSDRKPYQDNNLMRKSESPLRQSNNKQKPLNYEMQEILAYRDNVSNQKNLRNSQQNRQRQFYENHQNFSSINQNQNQNSINQKMFKNNISRVEMNNQNSFQGRSSIAHHQRSINQSYQQSKTVQPKHLKGIQVQSMANKHLKHEQSRYHEQSSNRTYQSQNPKTSSPNIIMAIMSLLDDLGEDGLEIIKRQTQKKLVERRHQQKTNKKSQR